LLVSPLTPHRIIAAKTCLDLSDRFGGQRPTLRPPRPLRRRSDPLKAFLGFEHAGDTVSVGANAQPNIRAGRRRMLGEVPDDLRSEVAAAHGAMSPAQSFEPVKDTVEDQDGDGLGQPLGERFQLRLCHAASAPQAAAAATSGPAS